MHADQALSLARMDRTLGLEVKEKKIAVLPWQYGVRIHHEPKHVRNRRFMKRLPKVFEEYADGSVTFMYPRDAPVGWFGGAMLPLPKPKKVVPTRWQIAMGQLFVEPRGENCKYAILTESLPQMVVGMIVRFL